MLGLICLGILNIFFYTQFMNTLYASLGAIVMSMYIVFDTQVYIYDNIILLLDLNDRKKTKYSWTRWLYNGSIEFIFGHNKFILVFTTTLRWKE